jgi:hypothetical protein
MWGALPVCLWWASSSIGTSRTKWTTTTLIAALATDGIGPALVLDGGVDTHAFLINVEQILAPMLRHG